jgi:ferredoxin
VLGENIIINYDILVVDDERRKIILPKEIQIPNDYEIYAWLAENRISNRTGIFWIADFSQNVTIPDIFPRSELPSAYLVDETSCRLCLNCMRVCPFGIPKFGNNGKSYIEKNLCNGCGVCASECPAKAIKRVL